jgi:hypothetical protein
LGNVILFISSTKKNHFTGVKIRLDKRSEKWSKINSITFYKNVFFNNRKYIIYLNIQVTRRKLFGFRECNSCNTYFNEKVILSFPRSAECFYCFYVILSWLRLGKYKREIPSKIVLSVLKNMLSCFKYLNRETTTYYLSRGNFWNSKFEIRSPVESELVNNATSCVRGRLSLIESERLK